MTIFGMPSKLIKKTQTILFKFLWGKASEKIKRKKLYQNSSEGGLSMIDMEALNRSLLASWIPRILNANKHTDSWVQIPMFRLKHLLELQSDLVFNFDNSIEFPEVESLPVFYKKIVQSYNHCFVKSKTDFENNIMGEVIWGNMHITKLYGKKKKTLFFRDWIRSGVRKIKDLKFENGLLDMNFMLEKIKSKHNIYCEILCVKQALSVFQNAIAEKRSQCTNTEKPLKSKHFYQLFITQNDENNDVTLCRYLSLFGPIEHQTTAIHVKILKEREIKLKEFNFKLFHGILPCNYNLMKWKIKLDAECDICKEPQTIKHLLFECCYAKCHWNLVNTVFNIQITYEQILGLDRLFVKNEITTLVSFLIYKEWLLMSLENKKRSLPFCTHNFKYELKLRFDIYKQCNTISGRHQEHIYNLLSFLN
jgi:hypothetical protein